MRPGQIRESCGGCNNAGCRSFSFCGRPKAEFALRHFEKKATHLRCSDSFHSLLSVFPCGSPVALREKRQRTFGAPTRFTPCCRIFHADRFALWENPQRSLRSLLWLRLQGREIRRNFLKIYSDMLRPVPILCSQQGSILCRSIRPEIFRISAAGWCLCHPDNGIEKLKFLYESLWDTISIQAFSI